MKSRIERALLNAENVVGNLLNALGDRPPMLGAEGQRSENEEVQSALRKVNTLGGQRYPFCFYKSKIYYLLSKCKGGAQAAIRKRPFCMICSSPASDWSQMLKPRPTTSMWVDENQGAPVCSP